MVLYIFRNDLFISHCVFTYKKSPYHKGIITGHDHNFEINNRKQTQLYLSYLLAVNTKYISLLPRLKAKLKPHYSE